MGGPYSSAKLSYGFVLSKPQALKLAAAFNKLYRPGDVEGDVEGGVGGDHQVDMDELEEQLGEWLDRDDTAIYPYWFEATAAEEGYEDKKLLVTYAGMDDSEVCKPVHEVTAGGFEGVTCFTALSQPLTDSKFLDEAQKALERIEKSQLFKDAGLTDIVPQWILSSRLEGI